MRLQRSSLLPVSLARAEEEVAKPRLLQEISTPMVVFEPLDPPAFGPTWEPRAYRCRLKLGGVVPIGEHTLDIDADPAQRGATFHDAGYSDLIHTWDHRIVLEDVHGMTRYTDKVEVRAGLLTPVAWAFAWLFYRHRQQRLVRLASRGFAALA